MKKTLLSTLFILILTVTLIPSPRNPVTASAEGQAIDMSVPAVVDGLRAFPISVSINDPAIKDAANHFEVKTSHQIYNVSDYYRRYDGLQYVENNYNGEDKLEFKAKYFYPSLMSSTKDGAMGYVQVSFYTVTLLGNLPTIDEKAFNAPKGSLYTWRLPNGSYDHYKKSLIASATMTLNLAPLLLDLKLPSYPEKYNETHVQLACHCPPSSRHSLQRSR